MRCLFSFIMQVGTYTPHGAEVNVDNLEEAAQVAKEFYVMKPYSFGSNPVRILITTDQFTGSIFNFETLERIH